MLEKKAPCPARFFIGLAEKRGFANTMWKCMPKSHTLRILGGAMLTLSCNAYANTGVFSLSLEELLNIEISSATLTPKARGTAPSSVTVFTRGQLDALPVYYLHDLMNYVPGFQSFRQGEAADEFYHSVRGRRIGTSSREVLILVDGVRLNREIDAATAVPSMMLDQIERVEFVRGPGSALYGSNAFLGVINIQTRNGSNLVNVRAGAPELLHGSGQLSGAKGDWQWSAFAAAEKTEQDASMLEDSFGGDDFSSSDGTQKTDLRLRAQWRDSRLEYSRYDREADDYYVLENGTANSGNETENQFQQLRFDQKVAANNQWRSDLTLALSEALYEPQGQLSANGFANELGGSVPPSNEPLRGYVEQGETTRSLYLHNDWTPERRDFSLQSGAEYRHVRISSTDFYTNFDTNTFPIKYLGEDLPSNQPVVVVPTHTLEVFGAYAQGQWQLNQDWELIAGLRLDHYSSHGSTSSPRLALSYRIAEQHSLKLMYGEAFRAPTVVERMNSGNNTVIGNPDLEPEDIETLELNWLAQWSRAHLDTTLYYSRISDAIEQSFEGRARTFINSTETESLSGLESELNIELNRHWMLVANISMIADTPQAQFRQADRLASARLEYVWQNWLWNLSTHYVGERQMQTPTGLSTLDSYALLSSRLRYEILADHYVSLSVTNLGDEDYLTPTQGQTLERGLPNAGAQWRVEYSLSW